MQLRYLLAGIIMAIPVCLFAQTDSLERENAELLARIAAFDECFKEFTQPKPEKQNITLSNGKTISSIVQCDYERKSFVSVDETLKDVLLWKNSPYLWKLKHSRGNKTLMDDRELSDWEMNSADKIAKTYHEAGDNVFHIASHGLLNDDRTAGDRIRVGGQDLNAEETAELILESWKGQFKESVYHHVLNAKGQPITVVVHSCHSAEGEDNFAKKLSVELSKYLDNVSVVGAPDVVWCETDRDGNYTESVAAKNAYGEPSAYQKRWRVYKKGDETGEGDYDYRTTVKNIQANW